VDLVKPVPECLYSGFWAKGDGGDGNNWSYRTWKAPVNMSPPTNQHPFFYRPDALPVAQPTMSKHWRENITFHGLSYPQAGVFQLCLCSWLPWGRVVLPLISPLMPVPQVRIKLNIKLNYSNFYSTMRLQIQRRWAHLNDLPRVATWQCGSQESNPRSVDCKSSALTTTLPHTHTHQNLTYLLACLLSYWCAHPN